MHRRFSLITLLIAGLMAPAAALAEESPQPSKTKTYELKLAGGALSVSAPEAWEKVKPRNRIIEVELAVTAEPASDQEADKKPPTARLTIMAAGGSVDQNLVRWKGQFQRLDKESGKKSKREVAGMPLHTIDLAGTYMEAIRGPFGPKIPKDNYRMLAGILVTKDQGKYFFKLIGPSAAVDPNVKAFAKILDSAKVNK